MAPLRLLPVAFLACACVTLTPEGARVSVYTAPLDASADQRRMPEGCRFVAAKDPAPMTELEIEGQTDPYRTARNEAAAAGANVLLVLLRLVVPRHDLDCPGSSPITDCPPSSGAWFTVVIEDYACSPGALGKLQDASRGGPAERKVPSSLGSEVDRGPRRVRSPRRRAPRRVAGLRRLCAVTNT